MHRPTVVLPEPLSPTKPRVSCLRMEKVMSSTALISAIFFWKTIPEVTGKYIFRFWTSTIVSPDLLPFVVPLVVIDRLPTLRLRSE